MNAIDKVLEYAFSSEIEHWENETGLEYPEQYNEKASPSHIAHALIKLQNANNNIRGLYVTPDIADCNHGLVYGDTLEQAHENAEQEWQGIEIDKGNMQSLRDFLGL